MLTPQQLVTLFKDVHISTWGATCPICTQNSLRIYRSNGETGIRCLNQCNRGKILARVGVQFSDLRPERPSGLANSLAVSTQTAQASTKTRANQDAENGGTQ